MRTVLIVDDEFGIVDVLATILEDQGYRVFCAANGSQGLHRVAENRPDLIVSDFMMPVMTGPEMCQTLRADPATHGIPIIMMSSMPEPSVRQRFEGCDSFLQKPFRLAALTREIAKLLPATEP